MDTKRVITSLAAVPAVILAVHFGRAPLLALLAAIVVLGVLELFRMLDACKCGYQKYPGLIAALLVLAGFAAKAVYGINLLPAILTFSLLLFLSVAVFSGDTSAVIRSVSATVFVVLYVGWLPGHLLLLRGENPEGRWRAYDYAELVARDKASLDISWLKDDSLSDSDNLPAPEVIATEIVEDLEAALEQFREIAMDLAGVTANE